MLVEVDVSQNRNAKNDKKSDWSQKLKCDFNDLIKEWRVFLHHGSVVGRRVWVVFFIVIFVLDCDSNG